MTTVRVLTSDVAPATGWDTVTLMAELLADVLEAELVRIPVQWATGRSARAASLLRRRRGSDITVVIAPDPGRLYDVAHWRGLLHPSAVTVGWVIDSFWTDRIPRVAGTHFDHLFVTDTEVVEEWRAATGVPVTCLPFGADVLRRGSSRHERTVDVQRVGRQPAAWEVDDRTTAEAAGRGLVMRGRVPFGTSADGNQRHLMAAMADTKFTLSFSNAVSPAPYTHPTREYLTGRWTDALASGAVVAGVPPDCAVAAELLWPGATLHLPPEDLHAGLAILEDAANAWSPAQAERNHAMALRRLDWRWRFAQLAEIVGVQTPTLRRELESLSGSIDASAGALD